MNSTVQKTNWILLLPLLAILSGCARLVEESADDVESTLLDAYVTVNYNQQGKPISHTLSGLYIETIKEGTGDTPADSNFVYVNYTAYQMTGSSIVNDTVIGNIMSTGSAYTTNDSLKAKQLGAFSYSTYYGPVLWGIGRSTLYAGLEEALKGMRQGGKARVLMPSWCSTVGGSRALSSTTVFDIELLHVVPNIAKFQTDTLRAFSNRYYNGIDSTKYDFYYDGPVPASGDTLAYGDTVTVRYIGYLLDGFVFDTNIADSASYHKIYNSSKNYSVLSLVWAESMSIVDGFKYAVANMRTGDEAVTFFSSDYGYKSTGSGQIPAYAPLRFYLKVERVGRKE